MKLLQTRVDNAIFTKDYVTILIFIIPYSNIELYDFNSKIIKTNYMKLFRSAFALFLVFALLLGSTSCLVFHPGTDARTAAPTDNGGHRGWYKNCNNPHNPNTTNPGHSGDEGSPGNSGKSKGKKITF